MKIRSLRTRFLLAGCLLVAAAVACGAWSAFAFARQAAAAGDTLRESQETIDLADTLADALEREDDALLLSLTGEAAQARDDLLTQRRRFDEAYPRLARYMQDPEEKDAYAALRAHADAYREAGDALRSEAAGVASHDRYHRLVNPALRKAVADCGRIRELNFASMGLAGVQARNEAGRANVIVAGIALAALALSAFVMVRLARAVLGPVRELAGAVEAVRRDDLDCRVPVRSPDELGRLAEGFNRMAETLADYRRSSLGELLLAKSTLEATLSALPDAVIVVDPDGRIVSTNARALEVLRTTGGDWATRVQDLGLAPGLARVVEEVQRGGRPREERADLGRALSMAVNGRPRKMLLTVAPIPEFEPRRCGAVLVLDDVTECARLDELRGELVAVASHELKTPLTSLRMNLLLLGERADNLTPRQQEILAAAVHGLEELAATVAELLDLTRIEAGQLRLQVERVDLAALAEQTLLALRRRFDDAEVRLRLVNDAPEAAVRGDAARLRIVLANLLVNALKYTPRGGEVVVHLSDAPAGGDQAPLRIGVTDTGPGVPPEFRERIFEKFFRVEDQRTRGTEGVRGAGIGLYLCRQIVEAHGGSIRCDAGDGDRGARMTVSLPRPDGEPGVLSPR
jgi:NtrC-family two-component system sensor histidine kinase KinB